MKISISSVLEIIALFLILIRNVRLFGSEFLIKEVEFTNISLNKP